MNARLAGFLYLFTNATAIFAFYARTKVGLLAVFNQPQREALALFFLGLHGQGLIVVQIFWGLWLIPFGLLVMRSRFLPKILGILLLVNAVPYLLISVTALLGLPYVSVLNKWALIPELGEVWMMLWLLIKGAKVEVPSLPQREATALQRA